MSSESSFPSPRNLATYQKFYDNIKAIKEAFPDNLEARYDKYIEFFRKEKDIRFKRGVATDIMLFLMEKYVDYVFKLHFHLPVISIRGIISVFKLDAYEKTTAKKEYDNLRHSSAVKKGFLHLPDTWKTQWYIVTLGLKFFSEIVEITEYPKAYEYMYKRNRWELKLPSVDPLMAELTDGQAATLRSTLITTYSQLQRRELELENKLPEPEVGRVFDPERGLDTVILNMKNKQQVSEAVSFIQKIELARSWGVKISPRILLGGIVGTGKTLTAEAIAKELGRKVYLVGSEHLVAKYLGDTAKNVDQMFKYAAEHKGHCVLVIDEIEGLIPNRAKVTGSASNEIHRAVNTFLSNMESYPDIIIVGTTNRPTQIDSAALSRFSLTIWFDYPDSDTLSKITDLHFNGFPGYSELDIAPHIDHMELNQFTGRNVRDLSVACAMIMLSEDQEQISEDILTTALKRVNESKQNIGRSIDDSSPTTTDISIDSTSFELDDIDRQMLQKLKENPRLSFNDLSQMFEIPATTLHNRFNRLKALGYAESDRTGRIKKILI